MPEFIGKVLVTYIFEAENIDKAHDILYYDTEYPLFPDGVGGCVDTETISIEEAKQ